MAAALIGTVASTLPEHDDHPYRSGAWRPAHREWDADDLEVEGELDPRTLETTARLTECSSSGTRSCWPPTSARPPI